MSEEKNEQPISLKNSLNKPRRKSIEIDEAILNVLRLADNPPTTTDVAENIKARYDVAQRHLRLLEFSGKVEAMKFGEAGKWVYWKIRR